MILGTVEFSDVTMLITSIILQDRGITAIAEGIGPSPEYHGPARIIGVDGLLIQEGGHIDCPVIESGQFMQMKVNFSFTSPEAAQ